MSETSSAIVSTRANVTVDGRDRSLVLVRPDDTAPPAKTWRGRALVLVLHGSNQTGEGLRTATENSFDRLAESGAAVVAYPDGVGRHWNDARAAIDFTCRKQGIDDVAFIAAIIDRLARNDGIDRTRVYLVGFSNGAAMAIRVLLERPELIAGAAIIAATLPAPDNLVHLAGAERAVPVVLFHGTKDPVVPYEGGVSSRWGLRPRGLGLSAVQTAAFFAERNGITGEPTRGLLPPVDEPAPTIEITDFRHSGHQPVRLYTVRGGGHVVPGPFRASALMGATTAELVAVDAIAGFFGLA